MIKVIYYRKGHRVTVEGHANSAESGRDLVCAAASTLTYTLASFVASMANAGQVRSKCVKLESGNSRIGVKVDSKYDAATTLAFDAICTGYMLLARDYPDFVSYEIFEH